MKTAERTKTIPAAESLSFPSAGAAIANGIRNPLSALRIQIEFLRDQTDPMEPRRQTMDFALEEVDRVAEAVEAVLDHCETSPIQLQACDLAKVLEQGSRPLLAKAERRGIHIRREGFDRDIPATTDPRILAKTVQRLLDNAIDATPDGGEVNLYCDRRGSATVITVLDHGKGMTQETLDGLGEAFSSQKTRGIGLGIFLAKRDIKRIGGEIDFRSREGEGTTVSLKIFSAEESE